MTSGTWFKNSRAHQHTNASQLCRLFMRQSYRAITSSVFDLRP